MKDDIAARIAANPKFEKLKSTRTRYAIIMTILMMATYYGYILLIAFNKEFLGQRMGEGVTTLGVPIGMGVIIFTIVITGIYVRRANDEFDRLTKEIMQEVSK